MMHKTAFIGHRNCLPKDIEQRLTIAVQNQINSGCKNFIMGTHGDFDRTATTVCRTLKKGNPEIKIEVVVTNLNQIKSNDDCFTPQDKEIELTTFEIEEVHFKQQIVESNKQMIDSCDTLICYVSPHSFTNGSTRVLKYAIKKGLKIINLYNEKDDILTQK